MHMSLNALFKGPRTISLVEEWNVKYNCLMFTAEYNVIFCNLFVSRSKSNEYLKDLTRDNIQLLLNKVWELPTNRVEECIVAELPKPTYLIPRSQPVPKPKEPTRWEKFAKEKGIVKTKKSKLEWDEVLKVRNATYLLLPLTTPISF